ncbi:hypothetical protein DIS24_g8557 [Lasiodiplodia hormozganensis]|uniref:Uncharacterized protein n=2 Tax=Lasiodiplodia TaxID=66739 RepID=A0A5N5DC11_9PEZI|nr:hypothetical protein DBV05_g5908 [Lasiodiplodia theobromae]KAK0644775.1 hypothetical protein DIS24_g8557 [Lasiodiplodia hormozganensis]
MALARLAPSRTKADFFQRLGLSEDNPAHKELYELMKEEAAEGRRRTSQDPSNLVPQCRSDPTVQPPYSSNQITETAMHREVLNVYHAASARTRPYYQQGHYMDGRNEDNWIIRWLLWHVFRYRDNRNRHRGAAVPSQGGSPDGNNGGGSTEMYDPVRDL